MDIKTFTLRWTTNKDIKLKSMTMSLLRVKLPNQLLKREFSRRLKIGTREISLSFRCCLSFLLPPS